MLSIAVASAGLRCGPQRDVNQKLDLEGAGLACNSLKPGSVFYRAENEELKKRYPIPEFTPEQCRNADAAVFKQAARKLWDENGLVASSRTPLQQGIVRNVLIGQAFNRLVEVSRQSGQKWKPYWAFSAIYADDVIGAVMRKSYYDMSRHPIERSLLVSTQPEAVPFGETEDAMPLGNMSLVSLKMAEGNQRIATETLWQNLAAVRCGPEAVVRALEKAPPSDVIGTRSRAAWQQVAASASTGGREVGLQGNLGLLRVEQENIIQGQMYDSALGTVGGYMRLGNSTAVTRSGSGAMSFDAYAAKNGLSTNLADVRGRLAWMTHVIESDAAFLDREEAAGRLPNLLEQQQRKNACLLRGFISPSI